MTAPYFATMSLASMDPAASEWPEMRAILDDLPDLAGQCLAADREFIAANLRGAVRRALDQVR